MSNPKEFVIRHVVNRASEMREDGGYSKRKETHHGFQWIIKAIRRDDFLHIFLTCDPTDNIADKWFIQFGSEIKVRSSRGRELSSENRHIFSKGAYHEWRCLKWDRSMYKYLVDDKFLVEVRINIIEIDGIPKKKLKDFGESNKNFSDVILSVEGEKFYVSKLFLAGQTPYFYNTLLNPRFQNDEVLCVEEGLPVHHIVYLSASDFQNFLEDIHGFEAIEESTVAGILKVASYLQESNSVRRCEVFLKKSRRPIKEKLELALNYGLLELKENCLHNLKCKASIIKLIPGDPKELDPSIAAVLLQKYISLDYPKEFQEANSG